MRVLLTRLRGRIEKRAGRFHCHRADGAVGDLGARVAAAAEPIVVSLSVRYAERRFSWDGRNKHQVGGNGEGAIVW